MADEIKNEVETNIDEATSTDESLITEEQKEVDNQRIPYDRFKAKVDEANALKEKLAKIERQQEEAKRKELEETEQYKELYEQAKQEALATKKSAMLAQAGYDDEQTKLLTKLVEGETDEEISESIKLLKATIPTKDNYGDPSAFNGAKEKPKTVDAEEVGRNAVSRVLHKIKL